MYTATGITLAAAVLVLVFAALVAVLIVALVRFLRAKTTVPPAAPGPGTASFAEHLKTLRTDRNLSQEYVAEQIGVSRQAVSKWETGASEPSTANLRALAALYGVSMDELIGA